MKKIIIKNKSSKKFINHYPLVQEMDILDNLSENDITNHKEWVSFVSEAQQFIGYGYLGKQNKGIGWLLSFDEKQPINSTVIETIFETAFNRRNRYFSDELTSAFRLLNGEGDGFGGLTIDWYGGYLVLSWYNPTIYAFKEQIVASILNVLPSVKGVYEKIRFKDDTLSNSRFVSGEEAPEPLIVKENGINYATYLNDGLMTGIFLDQKEVRETLIDGLSEGKTVLNTFSYTGAFSVSALMGGASHTTSVDLAKRSIEKTQEQFRVNGIEPAEQNIVVMDVFNYFKYAVKNNLTFDTVIMDPPSFARNKKKTFSVAKDYGSLTTQASLLVAKKGCLIASTNAANVTFDKFEKMVEAGIKEANRTFSQVKVYRLPSDFNVSSSFEEGNYLKVLIYKLD